MQHMGSGLNIQDAPIKTGKVVGTQKPYGEGVAGHTGPESCGVSGNTDTEALTGVRAPLKRDLRQAWLLSSER